MHSSHKVSVCINSRCSRVTGGAAGRLPMHHRLHLIDAGVEHLVALVVMRWPGWRHKDQSPIWPPSAELIFDADIHLVPEVTQASIVSIMKNRLQSFKRNPLEFNKDCALTLRPVTGSSSRWSGKDPFRETLLTRPHFRFCSTKHTKRRYICCITTTDGRYSSTAKIALVWATLHRITRNRVATFKTTNHQCAADFLEEKCQTTNWSSETSNDSLNDSQRGMDWVNVMRTRVHERETGCDVSSDAAWQHGSGLRCQIFRWNMGNSPFNSDGYLLLYSNKFNFSLQLFQVNIWK